MILNLLLSVAFATTLIVKAPNANPHDFFIYAQNNEVEKISTHFLKCEKNSGLQQTLKEAQYHFLNGSLEKSRGLFKEIADQKWDCDWKEDERKMITFSFYRLAQISQNEMEQIQFLTDAINFDDTATPDDAIFPPPTVGLYKNLRQQLQKKAFSMPAFAKNYSYILRNGQFINLSQPALETYSLRARYTFVSDAYKMETLTVTAEELLSREVEPKPWVSGDCKNPQVDSEISTQPGNVKIFFASDCLAEAGKSPSPVSALGMRPLTAPKADGIPTNFVVSEKKSWFQRNYLWVGAAVAGSLLIANQIRHNNESSQTVVVPTSTYSGATNSAP